MFKNMKVRALIVSLVCVMLAGCGISGGQAVSIKDVTKSEIVTLKKNSSQRCIYAIRIQGRGSIAGKAEIQLMLNGEIYKKEELSGKIDFAWGGDWYSDTAEIRYIPHSVTVGSVSLKYDFKD